MPEVRWINPMPEVD